MNKSLLQTIDDTGKVGEDMVKLMRELYPICRSITGSGIRETLGILKKHIPLTIHEVPSGTKAFDWTVPKEWNIRDAYIKNLKGEKIVDFQISNLHVLNYSLPVNKKISLDDLKEHLFTLPQYPDWIPYRTTYYKDNWGFCLSHNQFLKLEDSEYEVYVDSSLENGNLTYGEYYIEGETSDEVLLSCHTCHPSLCNDNLSGIALVTFLGKYLASLPLRYSYRIILIPGTIGSITWLSVNEPNLSWIKHGLVVACVGDPGTFTYKKSRIGNAEIDKVVEHVLKQSGKPYEIVDFTPYGYDERQYCSPGFNLPVGCLHRTPHGQYPEYHTSADNFDFVRSEHLSDSLSKYLSVLHILEHNRRYFNKNPKCEPQLGKRGLYTAMGGQSNTIVDQMALLWVLNLSDGSCSLLDIAERSGMSFDSIKRAADALVKHDLLEENHGDEVKSL
ncbi:MAG: DUF4910 domain-containing protein [Planctomycetes bacterium]|nr:DUF4910 domain-containing protein [Planctomycetota bacterium]